MWYEHRNTSNPWDSHVIGGGNISQRVLHHPTTVDEGGNHILISTGNSPNVYEKWEMIL